MWVAACAAIVLVASTIVASWLRWRLRIPITWRASASAGFARRRMSLKFWPSPAVPIPSSLTITWNRSRVGRLKMLNRSRMLTGSVVFWTGTVGGRPCWLVRIGAGGLPGLQSM